MALRLVGVSKRFGRQRALDSVDVHVRTGDCYGFLGHNGAGKTTALRIALGLMPADGGHVLVDGFDAGAHVREARARMGGLIEVPGVRDGTSGLQNLRVLARLSGLDRDRARREAERLLEVVGLQHTGRKPVRAFSQGMRQRLGLAQALIGRPPYVLLDEPTNGLDPEGIADLRAVLERIRDEDGATVILSSHQLNEVAGMCNRVGIIRGGRMIMETAVEDLPHHGSYRVEVSDPEAAVTALKQLALEPQPQGDGALLVALKERAPEDVTGALVGAGCGVRAMTPSRPALEELYLNAETESGGSAQDPAPTAAPPAERIAPGGAVTRALRYDLSRWFNLRTLALLLMPPVLAVLGVQERAAAQAADAQAVDAGELATAANVTAFEALGYGLRAGLPLLLFIILGLASQSIAGELSQGTLRNLLLRPLTRAQAALGKIASLLLALTLGYVLLWGASVGAAAWSFEFDDAVEIIPNGEPFVMVSAEEAGEALPGLAYRPFLPLAAYAGLGFLLGAVLRSGTIALAATMVLAVLLDVGRVLARSWGWEQWLPSAYAPSPLGDTSYIAYYLDTAQGMANATFSFADTADTYPAAFGLVCFALAATALLRRTVP